MRKLHSLLAIVLLSALTSCNCYYYDTVLFDRMEPASMSFPISINRVGVIDASTENANATALLTSTIAQKLADAEYFPEVVLPEDSDLTKWKKSFDYPLSKANIDSICSHLGVDMFVCLYDARARVVGDLMMLAKSVSSVYLSGKASGTVFSDSVFNYSSVVLGEDELPEKLNLIDRLADKTIARLVPTWSTQERTLYTNGSLDFRDASLLYKSNKMDDAIALWKKVYEESNSKKKRYCAAHNIAVCYERQDSADSALVWVGRCLELQADDDPTKQTYTKLWEQGLSQRVVNLKKLELQLYLMEQKETEQ